VDQFDLPGCICKDCSTINGVEGKVLFSHLSDDTNFGPEKANVKSVNGMVAKWNAVKNRAANPVY
jgi:archaellum biogenesis protein FlaJ (TadC family)